MLNWPVLYKNKYITDDDMIWLVEVTWEFLVQNMTTDKYSYSHLYSYSTGVQNIMVGK